jgi:hypothetical protein
VTGTREAHTAQLKTQLDVWNTELDRWQAKAQGATAGVRLQYDWRIAALRAERDHAAGKLTALQAAGDDAWEVMRTGVDDAWSTVRAAFDRAKATFD